MTISWSLPGPVSITISRKSISHWGKKILWIQNTTLEIYFVYLVSKDPASFFADMQLRMIIHIICHSTSCPTPHLFIDGNNDFQQVKITNKIPTV